jgi:formylmethanofuran dehydrogenase subunit E
MDINDQASRIELGNQRYGSLQNDDRRVCAYCGKIIDKKDAVMIDGKAICETDAVKEAAALR